MLHYLVNIWLFFSISICHHILVIGGFIIQETVNQFSFPVEHNYILGFLSSMVLTSMFYLIVLINTKQYVVGFQYQSIPLVLLSKIKVDSVTNKCMVKGRKLYYWYKIKFK